MNDTSQLDTFESELLATLRREVAEHPAREADPAPVRRPRRRRRLAAVGATGVAACVVAVFGLGFGGGSPAYAVSENSAGDVIVTIHRLDDAAGLEKALSDRGIDADVSYDSGGGTGSFGVGSDSNGAPPPAPGSAPQSGTQAHGQGDEAGPSPTGPNGNRDTSCGLPGVAPATLTHAGSDWVLTIPQGSPLLDRPVKIGTDSSGALSVRYAGDQPGSYCGVTTMGTPPPGTDPEYSGVAPGRS